MYHFRLLYKKPFFFPIYGALRYGTGGMWELYKKFGKMEQEEWKLLRTYDDGEPGAAGDYQKDPRKRLKPNTVVISHVMP